MQVILAVPGGAVSVFRFVGDPMSADFLGCDPVRTGLSGVAPGKEKWGSQHKEERYAL